MPAHKKFKIQNWLIYRLWRISQEAGYELEAFYSSEFGLSPIEWQAIAAIANYEPLSAKDLAALVDINQVQMTRTLSSLLKQKLISRRTDINDRRRIVLSLNKKGETVYSTISPVAQALEDKLMAVFNKQERKQFLSLLNRLERRIEIK